MENILISKNGVIIPSQEANIPLIGPAFQGAQAVYESVRTYKKNPFRLEEHLIRLEESAAQVGFQVKHTKETIRAWVMDLIAKAPWDPQFLRITSTPTDVFIVSRPLEIDPKIYDGVRVITFPVVREIVKAKVVGTPGTLKAYETAQEKGAYEALLLNPTNNTLTEGSRSNILWVKDGVLYWCDHALSGITQEEILKLGKKQGIPIQESSLPLSDLSKLDELFLTQTSRGIVPIIEVDEIQIADGKPGKMTLQLMKGFQTMVES